MKTTISILLLCLALSPAGAQNVPDIKLHTGRGEKRTNFILDFATPFYVGNNFYVLHIGNRSFSHSIQTISEGRGRMIFEIPDQVADSLEPGRKIWLSYGRIDNITEEQLAVFSRERPQYCHILGTFSKTMITR